MSQLHLVGKPKADARADVILVHGLGGHHQLTWMAASQSAQDCWPEWLVADLPDLNVWSLDYPSAISRWFGHSMSIPERARNVLAVLEEGSIGERPVIFLCHSLGGLVVKKVLNLAATGSGPGRSLLRNVRGIVFMGTPNSGASVARWGVRLRLALGLVGAAARLSSLVAEMRRADPYILDLKNWYADNAEALGIVSLVLYETRPARGILTVVEADSADPGIGAVERIPLDADHFGMCKFVLRDEVGYRKVVRFIKDALARPSPRQTHRAGSASDVPRVARLLEDFDQLPSGFAVEAAILLETVPPLGRFLGREKELGVLRGTLTNPGTRSVCLLGPPGIGKSKLAVACLNDAEVAGRFRGRRVFVDLAGAARAEDVWAKVGASIGARANRADVVASLEQAPILLVLDNLEDVWEADQGEVEDALARFASMSTVTLLVTLRGAETPGAVPWTETITLDGLSPEASRLLFLAIAGRRFDVPALGTFLGVVDGLALAVELLAHRAQAEPDLASLVRAWDSERLTVMSRGTRDKRSVDMRTSIALSLASPRVSDAARHLFRLMGLLPQGLAAEDVGKILPGPGAPAHDLVRVGLVRSAGGPPRSTTPRLSMLAPIREYAREQQLGWDKAAPLVKWAFELVQTLPHKGELLGSPGPSLKARLELDNLHSVITSCARIHTMIADHGGEFPDRLAVDLAEMMLRVADAMFDERRFGTAEGLYLFGFQYLSHLLELDPSEARKDNFYWPMSNLMLRGSDVLFVLDRPSEAYELRKSALEVCEERSPVGHPDLAHLSQLALCHNKVGDLEQDTDLRRRHFARSLALRLSIYRSMKKAGNVTPYARRDLALSFLRIGLASRRGGTSKLGLKRLEAAACILRSLIADHPDEHQFRANLAAILASMYETFFKNDYEAAVAVLQEAYLISVALQDDPRLSYTGVGEMVVASLVEVNAAAGYILLQYCWWAKLLSIMHKIKDRSDPDPDLDARVRVVEVEIARLRRALSSVDIG